MKPRAPRAARIAIFGGSQIRRTNPVYLEAFEMARALSGRGAALSCGGYGGVMEAVARGARAGGGGAHGVLLAGLEGDPCPALASTEKSVDLYDRLRRLIEPAGLFVAFTGSSGTLNEIAMLLSFYRSGLKLNCPLILVGAQPRALMRALDRLGYLPAGARAALRFARTGKGALWWAARLRPQLKRKEKSSQDLQD